MAIKNVKKTQEMEERNITLMAGRNNGMNEKMNNGMNEKMNDGMNEKMNDEMTAFEHFKCKVKKALEQFYGDDKIVRVTNVKKNNGIELSGLTILDKDINISPTIYLEMYFERYKDGETLGDLIAEIVRVLDKHQITEPFDLSYFENYELIHNDIAMKLVNAEKNKKLLADIPHVDYLDMAIVFYYQVPSHMFKDSSATILIHNSHLAMWDIDPETIYRDAIRNTPLMFQSKIDSIQNVMMDIILGDLKDRLANGECELDGFDVGNYEAGEYEAEKCEPEEYEAEKCGPEEYEVENFESGDLETEEYEAENLDADGICEEVKDEKWMNDVARQMVSYMFPQADSVPMYILTNGKKQFGAACILYSKVLREFAESIGDNLYLLPSSVHEVILIPARQSCCLEQLKTMVEEVNRTEVTEEEVLTDSVYYYDMEKDELTIA